MRCLTLANALKKVGAQIRFVSRELPFPFRDILAAKEMELILLDGNKSASSTDELAHSHWLGISQEQDASDSVIALSDKNWDWLIVDHYALDKRWESLLRHTTKKIMVIDDIADRQHDCDLLLDQNFYADMNSRYNDKVPAHCQLLLGPKYALLRDEFRQLHKQVKTRSGPAKKIFVFFGGVDADNYTGLAIEILSEIDISDLHVDVVIGDLHPCREEIKSACTQHGFVCHVQTDRMAELMARADLAIGAGGSATWERCYCGLPTLVVSMAENQTEMAKHCAREGIIYYLGSVPSVPRNLIRSAIETFSHSNEARLSMSRNGKSLVDVKGCDRVISKMFPELISLKKATISDSGNIFAWRNDPSTRKHVFNSKPISLETHNNWFKSSIKDPNRHLLIGEQFDQLIGLFRIDVVDDFAWISVYLVPGLYGHGVGTQLAAAGCSWVRGNLNAVKSLRAEIMPKNVPSLRMLLGCGFVEHHRELRLLLK